MQIERFYDILSYLDKKRRITRQELVLNHCNISPTLFLVRRQGRTPLSLRPCNHLSSLYFNQSLPPTNLPHLLNLYSLIPTRQGGGDPVVAEVRDHRGRIIDLRITDNGDGSYSIRFTPPTAGNLKLCVSIFDRPIKESPFTIPVVDHNNPVWVFGSRGTSGLDTGQPVTNCNNGRKLNIKV